MFPRNEDHVEQLGVAIAYVGAVVALWAIVWAGAQLARYFNFL